MLKRTWFLFLMAPFLLTSCGPGKLFGPTYTPAPTNTATPTITPSLTATLTPAPEIPAPPQEFLSQIPGDKQYEITNGQVLIDGQAWFTFDSATNAWVEAPRQANLPAPFAEYVGRYEGVRLTGVKDAETDEIHSALMAGDNVLFVNEDSDKTIGYNPDLNQAKAEKTLADVFTYFKAKLCADVKGVYLSKVLNTAINSPELKDLLEKGCTAKLNAYSEDFTSMDPRYAPYAFNIPDQNFKVDDETPVIVRLVNEPTKNMIFSPVINGDLVRAEGVSISQRENGIFIISLYDFRLSTLYASSDYRLVYRLNYGLQYLLGLSGYYHPNEDSVLLSTLYNDYGMTSFPPLVMFKP